MNTDFLKSVTMPLTPVALMILAACSSPPPPPQGKVESYRYEAGSAGSGGQVVVDTTTANPTVVAINAAQRTSELKYPDGKVTTYKACPEVVNFSDI